MKKYIHVAKALKPQLTREAAEYIADEYTKLRSQDNLQGENLARVSLFISYVLCSFSC
jgi:DNA replication licensing factor MCM3